MKLFSFGQNAFHKKRGVLKKIIIQSSPFKCTVWGIKYWSKSDRMECGLVSQPIRYIWFFESHLWVCKLKCFEWEFSTTTTIDFNLIFYFFLSAKQWCANLQVSIKWLTTENAQKIEFPSFKRQIVIFHSTNLNISTSGPSK